MNKGPGEPERMAKYARTAATGHKMSPVAPTYSVTPEPNTSVLLCRKVITRYSGVPWLLTQMSPHESVGELNALDEEQVNSPDRRKAKKPKQHAAHYM